MYAPNLKSLCDPQIAEDMGEDTNPEMVGKVADYFMEHGQFEKAVELLVKSKRLHEALDLCLANTITIDEELAERMTVTKTANGENKGCNLTY